MPNPVRCSHKITKTDRLGNVLSSYICNSQNVVIKRTRAGKKYYYCKHCQWNFRR